MIRAIRNWIRLRRRRDLERQLKSLSVEELAALWITRGEIDHLVFEASQAYYEVIGDPAGNGRSRDPHHCHLRCPVAGLGSGALLIALQAPLTAFRKGRRVTRLHSARNNNYVKSLRPYLADELGAVIAVRGA